MQLPFSFTYKSENINASLMGSKMIGGAEHKTIRFRNKTAGIDKEINIPVDEFQKLLHFAWPKAREKWPELYDKANELPLDSVMLDGSDPPIFES